MFVKEASYQNGSLGSRSYLEGIFLITNPLHPNSISNTYYYHPGTLHPRNLFACPHVMLNCISHQLVGRAGAVYLFSIRTARQYPDNDKKQYERAAEEARRGCRSSRTGDYNFQEVSPFGKLMFGQVRHSPLWPHETPLLCVRTGWCASLHMEEFFSLAARWPKHVLLRLTPHFV